jgi:Protein of unknown function (DUF2568)
VVETAKRANLVLRFLLELAALAALAYGGYEATQSTAVRWALAIGLPVAGALVWGVLVSPRRAVDAPLPVRLVLEAAVLGGGVAALAIAERAASAIGFAVLLVVNRALMAIWRQ